MPRLQKHEGEELQLLKKVTPGLHTSHRDTQGTLVSPGRGDVSSPCKHPGHRRAGGQQPAQGETRPKEDVVAGKNPRDEGRKERGQRAGREAPCSPATAEHPDTATV